MAKVIIIGGGASGCVAAIMAARHKNEVILIEKNDAIGKKILITGNGRCNYWNKNQDISHYHSKDSELLKDIITSENQNKVLNFFDNIGIVPKIKNDYYYPNSNQATSIKAALYYELRNLKVNVLYNTKVNDIRKLDDEFIVNTSNGIFKSEKVIISTGSKAMPKTGSDGDGYSFALSLGHSINNVLPALTQVNGVDNYYKNWSGIRLDAILSLYEDDSLIKKEYGELQLTDKGISGICTFNLSGYVAKGLSKNKNEVIYINFIPQLNLKSVDDFVIWLKERNNKLNNRTIPELLDGVINYKLIYLFLKILNINPDTHLEKLSDVKQIELAKLFMNYPFKVKDINSFDKGQVCSGGVSLQEINLNTMESKIVKNLYFTGEILDVDGDCGGYNLGYAWMSGILAGESVGSDD